VFGSKASCMFRQRAWLLLVSALQVDGRLMRRMTTAPMRIGLDYLKPKREGAKEALLVLNTPLDKNVLVSLMRRADTVVCADGGANRVHDLLEGEGLQDLRRVLRPTAIKGDLDSIRDDVAAFYRDELGVPVIRDADQDRNDMDKCLDTVWGLHCNPVEAQGTTAAPVPAPGIDPVENPVHVSVRVLGSFSGRFDQVMAAFHCLYKWAPAFHGGLSLVSDDNAATVLCPGESVVKVDEHLATGVCGLIPIGQPCREVRTEGLQWNLDGGGLSFGDFISSSNQIVDAGEELRVSVSDPLVLTYELDARKWPAWDSDEIELPVQKLLVQ